MFFSFVPDTLLALFYLSMRCETLSFSIFAYLCDCLINLLMFFHKYSYRLVVSFFRQLKKLHKKQGNSLTFHLMSFITFNLSFNKNYFDKTRLCSSMNRISGRKEKFCLVAIFGSNSLFLLQDRIITNSFCCTNME